MEPMTLLFYGPNGVGKSTRAAELGGVDLEDFSTEQRWTVLEKAVRDGAPAVGMAGQSVTASRWLLSQLELEHRALHVLLLPSEPVYRARQQERNRLRPHKAGQMDTYAAFNNHRSQFDQVWTD